MSLIGPRPDPLDDMDIYTEHQKKKLAVRPGITGYNQAYYRNSVMLTLLEMTGCLQLRYQRSVKFRRILSLA